MRLLLFLLAGYLFSCKGQVVSKETESTTDFKQKYSFSKPKYEEIPLDLLKETFVPYYIGEGKYTISNFKGEALTTRTWDEITPIKEGFFWGRTDSTYNLYLLPDIEVLGISVHFKYRSCVDVSCLRSLYGDEIPKGLTKTFDKLSSRKTFEDDGKYGVKNSRGEVIVPAEYDKYPVHRAGINAILLRKNNLYGIMDTLGGWLLPLEQRKIKLIDFRESQHIYGDSKRTIKMIFELMDGKQKFIFDDKLELRGETPEKHFVGFDSYDIESATRSSNIRCDTAQWSKEPLDEFTVLRSDENNFVFDSEGNFVTAIGGRYDYNFRFTGSMIRLDNSEGYYKAPIGRFVIHGRPIYVRLTDGYIYSD